MIGWPYVFRMLCVEYCTPVCAAGACLAYTKWSRNPEPLWVTVPGYVAINFAAWFTAMAVGLDFDYLEYWSWQSPVHAVACRAGWFAFLAGFASVLWAGIRGAGRRNPVRPQQVIADDPPAAGVRLCSHQRDGYGSPMKVLLQDLSATGRGVLGSKRMPLGREVAAERPGGYPLSPGVSQQQ